MYVSLPMKTLHSSIFTLSDCSNIITKEYPESEYIKVVDN
jgi:hypothetical protein